MNDLNYDVLRSDDSSVPVYAWVRGVPFEDAAKQQALTLSRLPVLFKHVAIMPDVHAGYGSTVGCVIATRDVVLPAAVGVDIGCGMAAIQTSLPRSVIEDSDELRAAIEAVVPCGFGRGGPAGTWAGKAPARVSAAWANMSDEYDEICAANARVRHARPLDQLGTLGSGNHFVELCEDTDGYVWVLLHSGSRGPGNRIGTTFTKLAQEEMERSKSASMLPHKDLAFLSAGTKLFDDYVKAVRWAQNYAWKNRELMLTHMLDVLHERHEFTHESQTLCHHNYVEREEHFGERVWVTRKGAVRARAGDRCIIPGSMGARSIVGEGLGNPESFTSCSHGAGRTMSRTKARTTISLAQHVAATEGVACDKTVDTIDESPSAYKALEDVLAAQADLVRPLYYLKQFVCVKGKS